jgi:hypothetical protein
VSLTANADIFGPGRAALALARAAFGGRGFFVSTRALPADFVRVPYTFGEPETDRRNRLAKLAANLGQKKIQTTESTENTEGTEQERVRSQDPETHSHLTSALSALSVVNHPIVPTPVGEPQGLDTIAFFAAGRSAFPAAHIVVDLELLGHKLGQLCLSFGADAIVGTIVDQRALRLGERAGSNELTHDEAAQLLRASGFEPCAGLPEGRAREP